MKVVLDVFDFLHSDGVVGVCVQSVHPVVH